MIKVYIYNKENGVFTREETGEVNSIINALSDAEDFTLTPPPSFSRDWIWANQQWTKPELSEERKLVLQDSIWEGIKAERLKQTTSGVYVPSVDKVFHTDDVSVIQYNNIGNMIALGNFEPIQWKVMDNTWITMTEEVFKDLQIAMVQNTNRIYQVAEVHKAKMMQLDNPEDYDYSEGWNIIDPSN